MAIVTVLRFLYSCLVLAIVLACILTVASFSPLVQTWVAQAALAHSPEFKGSVGSVWAGFGRLQVGDLRLERDGAILTVPALEARIPITRSALDRKIVIRSLVATGWTLDLSRASRRENVEAAASPALAAARVFCRKLGQWELPGTASIDGVDLEGDVVAIVPQSLAPVRVHIVITGGGLAAGRVGNFTVAADAAPQESSSGFSVGGHLILGMDEARVIDRVEFKADLGPPGGPSPDNTGLSADLTAIHGGDGDKLTLDLDRGARHLATVNARLAGAGLRPAGAWKIDLRDSDLGWLYPDNPLPPMTVAGAGVFDADAAFANVHAAGRLKAAAGRLGFFSPALDVLGSVTLDAGFDVTANAQTIHVGRLEGSFAGERLSGAAQALQSFDVDEKTGDVSVANPAGDWARASVQGFPLASLSGLPWGFTFSAGAAGGDFTVRREKGVIGVRLLKPFSATGLAVVRSGRPVARDLDLSGLMTATFGPDGWQARCDSLAVSSGGRPLASASGTASGGGSDQPVSIGLKWTADLEAIEAGSALPGNRALAGRSASGDFTATVGSSTEIDGEIAVAGRDPDRTFSASGSVTLYENGDVSFSGPIKMAFGPVVSDFSVEGTQTTGTDGSRFEIRVTGAKASLEQLGLLGTALAAAGGGGARGEVTPAGIRDRVPFWGSWAGSANVALDQLSVGGRELLNASGVLQVDAQSLRLERGRSGSPHDNLETAEGSISFDAGARLPYRLKGTATLTDVDAAVLFGKPPQGQDPLIEGRFTVEKTFAGSGMNLEDLADFTTEQFRVTSTSTGGILRLFKTTLENSNPESQPSSVSDTLGTVGSAVGSFFGVKHDSDKADQVRLGRNMDAVLNFTFQVAEIGYDQISLAGATEPDHSVRLVDLEMTAPDERVTGSGRISHVEGLPLAEEPLSVELHFAARNSPARLLRTAGLLSGQKDSLGYSMLNQSFHVGGTLEKIDLSAWRDLLTQAATRNPDAGK